MSDDDVATGFPSVDARACETVYTQCLDLLDTLPYFRRYKTRSYDLLDRGSALTVLDMGCGLGDDARRMVDLVKPHGRVFGIDRSRRMLEARGRGRRSITTPSIASSARAPHAATTPIRGGSQIPSLGSRVRQDREGWLRLPDIQRGLRLKMS